MKKVNDKLEDVAGFLGLAIKELNDVKTQLSQDSDNFWLDAVEEMCVESLSPEKFEMWEKVKEQLKITRKHIG